MKVCVTQEDIKKGKRNSSILCPVARAIKRAAGCRYARVSHRWIEWGRRFEDARPTPAPPEVSRFVSDFDLRAKVEPFEFDL